MSRQIVQLHTIEQWLALDPSIRPVILQNIKLRDRLYRFLYSRNAVGHVLTEPKWVACSNCNKHNQTPPQEKGWVLLEPRFPGIHPSQLGQPCMLKIFNEMIGKEGREKKEPRGQLILDLGTAIHLMFQGYGRAGAWGPYYRDEVQIGQEFQQLAADLMIEGHADAENILTIDDIPNAPIFEVGLVHEYKSANKNNFGRLTGPKPEHKQQALVYAAALNRPVVVYMYLNKDDQNLVDYPIAFDQNVWAALDAKIRRFKSYFDSQTPPPGEVGYHCKECAYMYDCEDFKKAQPKAAAAR